MGDDPLEEFADDPLDRERLSVRLTAVLGEIPGYTESAVVALVGPWGSGKTTLLNAVERKIRESSSWYVSRYNPWSYSTYESAVSGFFSELRSALPDDSLGSDRRGSVGRLGARLAPLGAVGGLAGVDASGILSEVSKLVAGDQSPEALRKRAEKELRTLDRPVLVVLDDLDRLEPGELLLTFKLVRLLGRLPNMYYLLSYDEATLEAVLGRTDLIGSGAGRARDYLEKMVQVRLDIPPLLAEQRDALINDRLSGLLQRHDVQLDEDANTRLQQAYGGCLIYYMTQPRAIKKLFTQVEVLWPQVKNEVDFVDFFLVTFLRSFERGAFDLMVKHRDELLGLSLLLGSSKESNSERWDRWVGSLAGAGVREANAIAVLLSELFLPLRSARENMTYGSDFFAPIEKRKGIGSSEYFDRYTQFSVPKKDLSDAVIVEAIAQLDEDGGDALETVSERMATDANLVVRKLRRLDESGVFLPEATIDLLAKFYRVAADQKSGPFGLSPDFYFIGLAIRILDRIEVPRALVVLDGISATPPGLLLASDVTRKAMSGEERDRGHRWVREATAVVQAHVERAIREAARMPLSEETSVYVIQYLWALRRFRDDSYVQDLLWELISGDGPWTLEDVLAAMVSVGSASDGRSSWPSLGELEASSVDSLLDLDKVLAVGPLEAADGSKTIDSFERRRAPVDFESRKRYAASVIERIRVARRSSEDEKGSGGPAD